MEFFQKKINPRAIYLPIQVVFLPFQKKLQETNELLRQPVAISSAIDKHLIKNTCLKFLKRKKSKELSINTNGF